MLLRPIVRCRCACSLVDAAKRVAAIHWLRTQRWVRRICTPCGLRPITHIMHHDHLYFSKNIISRGGATSYSNKQARSRLPDGSSAYLRTSDLIVCLDYSSGGARTAASASTEVLQREHIAGIHRGPRADRWQYPTLRSTLRLEFRCR